MLAKGVIRDIVWWKQCRTYFYYRLKRRIEELRLSDALVAVGANKDYHEAMAALAKYNLGGDKATFETLVKLKAQDVAK